MEKKQDTAVNAGVKPMIIPGTGALGWGMALYEPFQPSPKTLKSTQCGNYNSFKWEGYKGFS